MYHLSGTFCWKRNLLGGDTEYLADVYAGIITPDTIMWPHDGVGFTHDSKGYAVVTDFHLDEKTLYFNKRYYHKTKQIKYSFQRLNSGLLWSGQWELGSSRGVAICYLYETRRDKYNLNELLQNIRNSS